MYNISRDSVGPQTAVRRPVTRDIPSRVWSTANYTSEPGARGIFIRGLVNSPLPNGTPVNGQLPFGMLVNGQLPFGVWGTGNYHTESGERATTIRSLVNGQLPIGAWGTGNHHTETR